MVFSSSIFLFVFLPLFLVTYFAVPWRPAKNVILLLFSLFFYAWGEPIYVLLMIGSIVLNWVAGVLLSKLDARAYVKRGVLIAVLVIDIGVLGLFKYEGFVVENVNAAFAAMNPLGELFWQSLELKLPIGISFFTLQAISYVVDVYRGRVIAQRNPLYLGMYIAMFPQLIAGPIVRYSHIEAQIDDRHVTFAGFAQGIRLFIVGLGKKVILANTAAILADSLLMQPASAIGFIGCFSGVLAYTFQIYFDFSGYSDMAIGLGKMMGFDYPRNFNYPYISKSVTEFWRRWHMTLGSFFRDYVYIPLGGSRVSVPRWMFNIMVVWALTGIWHGAAWNFLLWGLYYGILLMIEKLVLLRVLPKTPRVVQHLYCIIVFFFGWMLFALSGLENVGEWFLGMLGAYGMTGTSTLWQLQSWSYLPLLPIFVLGCMPVFPWIRKRLEAWAAGNASEPIVAAPEKGNDFVPPCVLQVENAATSFRARIILIISVAVDIALLAVLVFSFMMIVSGGYNPFIYFQF